MTSDPDLRGRETGPRAEDASDRSGVAETTVDCRGSFVREKFLWLEQVRADPELTPLAFLLAYVLGDLVNDREGCAWPSIARLAAECRATERGVQKVIRRLVERGHLVVETGNGRGKTNRYRWIVRSDCDARKGARRREDRQREPDDANDQSAPARSDRKGRTAVHPFEPERVNHGSGKGEQPFQKGRTAVHPTQSKESNYDPFYRLSPERSAQSSLSAFDDFWRAYPKKVGCADAVRAFAAAVLKAPADEIIRGASRYAAERRSEDQRYTKNPATWLNKGCWNEASPPLRALPRGGAWQGNPFDQSVVSQLHEEGDFEDVLARLRQQRNKRG